MPDSAPPPERARSRAWAWLAASLVLAVLQAVLLVRTAWDKSDTVDETTYAGGTMGYDHPISWYHYFEGGRAWYTGMGHTESSYSEPLFLDHLLGGILYAAGKAPADEGGILRLLVPPTTEFGLLVRSGDELAMVLLETREKGALGRARKMAATSPARQRA